MDDIDDDGPVAVRDYPEGCVRMPRRAAKNSVRPRPAEAREGVEARDSGKGESPVLCKLPSNFHQLSSRDQFLQRRELYSQLSEHFEREKRRGNMVGFRPDLQVLKYMNEHGLSLDCQEFGAVPGVEVGDSFDFRSEIYVLGLHRQVQGGIAWVESQGEKVACSVVISGGYGDDVDCGQTVEYTGQGGNDYRGNKRQLEDQKPNVGNRALINSCKRKTPVRVIRGDDTESSGWNKIYSYDGLYKVTKAELQPGKDGHKIYKFKLERLPGQPPLNTEKREHRSLFRGKA